MGKNEYQKKYAEVKKKLHVCGGSYDSKEYQGLKQLMNFYYKKSL